MDVAAICIFKTSFIGLCFSNKSACRVRKSAGSNSRNYRRQNRCMSARNEKPAFVYFCVKRPKITAKFERRMTDSLTDMATVRTLKINLKVVFFFFFL